MKNPALSEDDRLKGAEIIARNAKAQAQLISDFLEVHRIENERLGLRATPSAPPIAVAEREAGDAPDSLRGLKVLVVDDDADAHEPIRRVLEDYGAEVVAVRSVTAALDAIPSIGPTCSWSDISMPTGRVRSHPRGTRAPAPPRRRHSRYRAHRIPARPAERRRALNAGYMNHFAKPIEATVLVAVVCWARRPAPEKPRG